MKQGQANTSVIGSTKVEPRSKAVNPEAVANIGLQQITYKPVPMYEGRGLKAPMVSTSQHKSGSQGKH